MRRSEINLDLGPERVVVPGIDERIQKGSCHCHPMRDEEGHVVKALRNNRNLQIKSPAIESC